MSILNNILPKKKIQPLFVNNSPKQTILKKIVPEKQAEFTFPELINAEKYMRLTPRSLRFPAVDTKEAERAFGKENMQNPKFKKELKRLQEKFGITYIT